MTLAQDYKQMFDGFYGDDEDYDQWYEDLQNFIWDGSDNGVVIDDKITYASWKGAEVVKIIHFNDGSYLQVSYWDSYGQGDEEPSFKIVEPYEKIITYNYREVK